MLLDNKKNGKVGDALRDNIQRNSRLSIISGMFSIYAYEALKKELSQVEEVRLLFSKIPSANHENLHLKIHGLNGDKYERRFQNKLEQVRIARECATWLSEKSEIRAVNGSHVVNQSIFHINNGEGDSIAIQGSYNVSSITDNGTGDYTVTWDTDFADTTYAVVISAEANEATNARRGGNVANGGQLAGSANIITGNYNSAMDLPSVYVMAIGAQ